MQGFLSYFFPHAGGDFPAVQNFGFPHHLGPPGAKRFLFVA
jgi:hypothetical protein